MFESYCHYGNNLYIDNVLIANNVGVSEQNLNNETFEVIPNPSDGLFNISATNITGKYDIIIRNIHGQVVWNKNYSDSQTAASYEVNLSEEAKGVYFVEIKSANKTMSQKLVIK
jgi:hypothetical protein